MREREREKVEGRKCVVERDSERQMAAADVSGVPPPPPPPVCPVVGDEKAVKKRFEIKKWNAVALWAWGTYAARVYTLYSLAAYMCSTRCIVCTPQRERKRERERLSGRETDYHYIYVYIYVVFVLYTHGTFVRSRGMQILLSITVPFAATILWTCVSSVKPIRYVDIHSRMHPSLRTSHSITRR